MKRRLATLILVATATATASLWWLNDGDIIDVVQPVIAEWDAGALLERAGLDGDALAAPDRYTETDSPSASE